MDAIRFLEEKVRMCDTYKNCRTCPLYDCEKVCSALMLDEPAEVIAKVEKWSEEHSKKTIMDDFLEKHPNATLIEANGIPFACADDLGYVRCNWHDDDSCEKCWNTPLSEVK